MRYDEPADVHRVTFLASVLSPRLGMENALLRLAAALADRHHVEILVMNDPGPLEMPGVLITSLDAGSPCRTRRALRLRLRARAGGEILIVTGLWAAADLLLSAPWRFPSAVAWEHSITPQRLTGGRRFRLAAEAVGRCYRHYAGVVSVSPTVASTLKDRWRVDSMVVPNLLDLPVVSPGARRHFDSLNLPHTSRRQGPAHLIALGEAKPVKNYDLLIRALPLLDMEWHLEVVGGGPQVPELQALAERLAVADRIRWTGRVENPSSLLADSDLLVHPSISETFGYALLEAAEQWLPVVAIDAPVMNTLVAEYVPGVLTAPDAPSLAASIGTALQRFSADASPDFVAADERRRRAFGVASTLASWERVLGG